MQPDNLFLNHSKTNIPIICGPMYPCSNPELVAAVSNEGALGIIQPVSLTYIHGFDFREGLRYIKTLTDKPVGMNALIEKSSKRYIKKMALWIDIALEEGIRFFITSLGNPDWVVAKVHAKGGVVYHDVTEKKWAEIAVKAKVDGLIAVNSAAGGHAGKYDALTLYKELQSYQLPLICAGGVGDPISYAQMLELGYQGVQMGTRFIASQECKVPLAYKEAIVQAQATNIVRTSSLTGVPLSVIGNDILSNRLLEILQSFTYLKGFVRLLYMLKALRHGKKSLKENPKRPVLWVAGKSVEGIHAVSNVAAIIHNFHDPILSNKIGK